ncbi:MAG: AAA family ATPase [Methanomicrobiales archaeon]
MQLLRLQMRNFRRYRHQDVVFRDGITGILGNNGTGKSTIVDAILFCLYGVRETGLDYILSATAGRKDRAEVRLDFSVRGGEYQVVRSLGPQKRHDAQLNHNGRLMAKGVSEVQEALKRIIRMGHADFRHTIFSGQRELLKLVDTTPEERKRWFRRVLGIDSLKDEGGEILRSDAGAARERLLQIEGRLREIDPLAIQGDLEDLGKRITDSGEKLMSLDEDLRSAADRRGSLEKAVSELRVLEKEALRLRTLLQSRDGDRVRMVEELAGISREMEALGLQRGEFQDLAASEPGFEALRERLEESRARSYRFQALQTDEVRTKALISDGQETLDRLRHEEASLGEADARLESLKPRVARRAEIQGRMQEIGSIEERYHALMAEKAKKAEALSGAAERGATLRARIGKAKEARERLASLAEPYRSRVSLPGDPVAGLESLRRELLERKAGSSATRDQTAKALKKMADDLAALEARGTEGDCPTCHQPLGPRYRQIMEAVRRDMEGEKVRVSEAEKALKVTDAELSALETALTEAHRLREVSNRMEELTAEWEAIQDLSRVNLAVKDRLERDLQALAFEPAERQRLETELARLEEAWGEHVALSERVKRRPSLARDIRDALGRLEQQKETLAALRRDREESGFDPEIHARLEKEFRIAEERHRRYLAMKPDLERLPHLEERARGLAGEAAGVKEDLARLAAELQSIPFSPEILARKEVEIRAAQEQALRTAEEATRCRADLVHLGEEKKRLEGLLRKSGLDRAEHDRLGEEIRLLELTRDQLNGFTDHLLGIVRDQIQEETGRILSEITDGRYDTVILDDSFEILVHDLGGDYPVARFSGGEQDDVAIALRIALSRYIAEMHELHDSTFLIFDEIFGSQDEERRANIFRSLRALEPYFPQIFLISHVTEVQGEFGNTLLVEAVSGNESRIRDLEEAAA